MKKRCIALFNDGWADWEAGPVLAGLREFLGWEVSVATPQGALATSKGGVKAQGDLSFEQVAAADLDMLIVIGSDAWAQREFPEVTRLLREVAEAGKPIGAICAGTVAAAHAGLLDERHHTSNERGFLEDKAPSYKGDEHYLEVPHAISHKNVVTASGLSPATFAAEIFCLADLVEGTQTAEDFLKYHSLEYELT
jgi:putative intracellular protease/amidase